MWTFTLIGKRCYWQIVRVLIFLSLFSLNCLSLFLTIYCLYFLLQITVKQFDYFSKNFFNRVLNYSPTQNLFSSLKLTSSLIFFQTFITHHWIVVALIENTIYILVFFNIHNHQLQQLVN